MLCERRYFAHSTKYFYFVSPLWEFFCESFSSFPLTELILTKVLLKWHKVRDRNQKDVWLLWRITVTLKNNTDPCCDRIWTQKNQNFTVHCLNKRYTIHSLLLSFLDVLFYKEDKKVIRQGQKNPYFTKLVVMWGLNLSLSGSASQGAPQFLAGSATLCCVVQLLNSPDLCQGEIMSHKGSVWMYKFTTASLND